MSISLTHPHHLHFSSSCVWCLSKHMGTEVATTQNLNMVKVNCKVQRRRHRDKGRDGVSLLVSCRGRHSPANGLPFEVSPPTWKKKAG